MVEGSSRLGPFICAVYDPAPTDQRGHTVDQISTTEADLQHLIVEGEVQQLHRELVHRRVSPVEDARDDPADQARGLPELARDELRQT
jgi:hypothetical protein